MNRHLPVAFPRSDIVHFFLLLRDILVTLILHSFSLYPPVIRLRIDRSLPDWPLSQEPGSAPKRSWKMTQGMKRGKTNDRTPNIRPA